MKYLKPILVAIFVQLVAVLAPLLVFLALPLIRWDKLPSLDDSGNHYTIRGDFPRWLTWLGTPDERLPGGLYEPTVAKVFSKFGRVFCTWYWAGVRNRMHGLAASFGVPAEKPWGPQFGLQTQGKLWWVRYSLWNGKLAFKAGYRVYTLLDKSYLAVPVFTITKA